MFDVAAGVVLAAVSERDDKVTDGLVTSLADKFHDLLPGQTRMETTILLGREFSVAAGVDFPLPLLADFDTNLDVGFRGVNLQIALITIGSFHFCLLKQKTPIKRERDLLPLKRRPYW